MSEGLKYVVEITVGLLTVGGIVSAVFFYMIRMETKGLTEVCNDLSKEVDEIKKTVATNRDKAQDCKHECDIALRQAMELFNSKLDKGRDEFKDIQVRLGKIEITMEHLVSLFNEGKSQKNIDTAVEKILTKTATNLTNIHRDI